MSSDRIIVDSLMLAYSLVWQNLRPTTDAATVLRLRELLHSPSVRSALERGSDSLPTFALREVARVLTDQSQGGGQGEYAPAKHVLDSEPGSRVTGAGAYTATCAVTHPRQEPYAGTAQI